MVYHKIVHNVNFSCPDHHHACAICKQYYQDDQMHLMYNGRIFDLVDNKCLEKSNIDYFDSTTHFDVLFIEEKITIDSKLSLSDSVQKYIKLVYKKTILKKQMCHSYYLLNDLITLKCLCNTVSNVLPNIRKAILKFQSLYQNEDHKLLSNYNNKEIEKIVNIDPNLGTQEKIYLWLCKKCT